VPLVVPKVHKFDTVLYLTIISTDNHQLIYILMIIMGEYRCKTTLCFSHFYLRYDVPSISALIIHFDHIDSLTLRILATEDPYLLFYAAGLPILRYYDSFEFGSGHVKLCTL
jgi:hypothetical protein